MSLNLTTAQATLVTSIDTKLEAAFQAGVLNNGAGFLPAMTGYSSDATIGGGVASKAAANRTLIKQNCESILAALISALNIQTTAVALCKVGYNQSLAQTIPNATLTTINFANQDYDTDSAVTTGTSWVFTIPVNKGGVYRFSAAVAFVNAGGAAAETFISLIKNGVEFRRGTRCPLAVGAIVDSTLSVSVLCVPGDTFSIQLYQSGGLGTNTTEPHSNGLTQYFTAEGPF